MCEIPIHNHFYVQTMYILSGQLLVYAHDPETDEKTLERTAGPNDIIFVPSMEPHSMKNVSEGEEATFLCCIANVYEEIEGGD
jgi:quercetin dioxygenase-like cupin family protein